MIPFLNQILIQLRFSANFFQRDTKLESPQLTSIGVESSAKLPPKCTFPIFTQWLWSSLNNDDYGFNKYSSSRTEIPIQEAMTTEEDEEDLCVVGTVVKAITLWGQKCQSSSRRTIPQLLEISENCCSNCYRKNSLLWTWVHMCFKRGLGQKGIKIWWCATKVPQTISIPRKDLKWFSFF